MKRILSLILSLVLLGMVHPIQAQNPFKKIEKVIREQVGLPNSSSSESEKSAEAESSAEGGTEENSSPTPFPWEVLSQDDSIAQPPRPSDTSRGEDDFTSGGIDESRFEPSDFSSLPVTDLGIPGKGPFAIRSGMVIYEKTIENQHMNGTIYDTLYFDDFGWKQARHTRNVQQVNMMGFAHKQESYSIGIIRDDTLYSYEPGKSNGSKMPNPGADVMGLSPDEQARMGKQLEEDLEVQRTVLGSDLFLNKRCEVSDQLLDLQGQQSKVRLWLYKQIPLQTISSGMGVNLTETATDMQEDIAIPSKRFELPREVEFRELGWGR